MSMDNFVESLTDEQRAELLKALSGGDKPKPMVETEKPKEAARKETFVDENFRVHRAEEEVSRTTVRGKGSETDFLDPGGARGEETEMPEAASKIPPTARARKAPIKREYTCETCGDKFKENPDLVYGEHHRCDRCKKRSR